MQFYSKGLNKDKISIFPDFIDTKNPNFLMLENKYIGSVIAINYSKEMESAFLDKVLALKENMQISIFYEKQNPREVIRKITYNIGNTGADIRSAGDNQIDSDIMSRYI